jgi:hypothetical protein
MPLKDSGSTAPEAKRAMSSRGAVEARESAREQNQAVRRINGVSSTAAVAPPTYPTVALNICKTVPPDVAAGRHIQPRPVAKTETNPAATAC